MRPFGSLILGAALVAGAACAARYSGDDDAQRDLAKALAGRVPGKTSECIDVRADGPQIIGKQILLYRQGSRLWRNDLVAACPSLGSFATVIIDVHGSQICRNDHFRTIRSGETIPSPICRLGNFTAYDKPKR